MTCALRIGLCFGMLLAVASPSAALADKCKKPRWDTIQVRSWTWDEVNTKLCLNRVTGQAEFGSCKDQLGVTFYGKKFQAIPETSTPNVARFNSQRFERNWSWDQIDRVRRAGIKADIIDMNRNRWPRDLEKVRPKNMFLDRFARFAPAIYTKESVDEKLCDMRNHVSDNIADHRQELKKDLDAKLNDFSNDVREKLAREIKSQIELIETDKEITVNIYISDTKD